MTAPTMSNASAQQVFGQPHHHLVLKASAGTGKTHRLSARFLRLIANGADPASIMASTFTRAAAGEIRERVVLRLARAACGDQRALNELHDDTGGIGRSDYQAQDAARDLDHLLSALPRLRSAVTTLDGWLAGCVGMLLGELGLEQLGGLGSADEPAQVALRDAALLTAIEHIGHGDAREGLALLLDGLSTSGTSGRSSLDLLARAADDWGAARDEQPDRAAWGLGPAPDYATTEADPTKAIAKLVAAKDLLPTTKKGEINKVALRGWTNDCQRAEAEDWVSWLSGGIPKAIIANPDQPTYSRSQLDPALVASYQPVINHALAWVWQDLDNRAQIAFGLVGVIQDELAQARRASGRLTFDSLPGLLAQAFNNDGTPLLEELAMRLDGRVRHLLLDEFQDTSRAQWSALLPLAGELLATGGEEAEPSTLIVGDIKQAIYRWRGGCSAIMRQLPARHHLPAAAVESMDRSYRSSAAVLAMVDQVFERVADIAAGCLKPNLEAAAERIAVDYHPHQAARDLPGRTRVIRLAADANNSSAETDGTLIDDQASSALAPPPANPYTTAVVAHIAELRAECPGLSIAVLLRKRGDLYRGLLSGLAELGIPAHGEGGVTIGDHPAVGQCLALLRLAGFPGDTAAWQSVRLSPVASVLPAAATSAALTSAWVQERCLQVGLDGFLADAIKCLQPACDQLAQRRLNQLLGLATNAITTDPALHDQPERLADIVASTPVRDPGSETDVVQIMTVHNSKGLEFDLVVLPELHGRFGSRDAADRVLLVRDDPTEPPTRVLPRPTKDHRAWFPELDAWANTAEVDAREEDLCLLYVAMTRAVHGLDCLIPDGCPTMVKVNGDEAPEASPASLMAQIFGGVDDAPDRHGVIHEHQIGSWPPTVPAPAADESVSEPLPFTLSVRRSLAPSRHRLSVTPSGLTGADRAPSPAELLHPSSAPGLAVGTLTHRLLEQVGFLDRSALPSLEAWQQRAHAAAASDEHSHPIAGALVEQVASRVHAFLASSAADVLASDGASDCWRERPFLIQRANGSTLTGSFDRVHIWRDDTGTATRALILDYKTDRITDPEDLARLNIHYAPQLDAYCEAITAMLGPIDVSAALVPV